MTEFSGESGPPAPNTKELSEEWQSPFRGMADRYPDQARIYLTAEAIWAVDSAARQQAEAKAVHPVTEAHIDELIRKRDELFVALNDEEKEMAMNHARLAVGPYEGPEVDDEPEIYEVGEEEVI